MSVASTQEHSPAGASTPSGRRIRDRRVELGLSQAEVAEGMLSASYLSLVETGRRTPAVGALEHIAERLGVDVGWLKDGIDASVRTAARLALSRAEHALRDGAPSEAYEAFTELIDNPGLDDGDARRARLGRALAKEREGDLDSAIDMLSELLEEARLAPEVQPWFEATEAIMRCYRELGDLDMAVSIGEDAMRRAVDLRLEGTDHYIRLGTNVLGAYTVRGDIGRSRQLSRDLIVMADQVGSPLVRGGVYWNASVFAENRGDLAQAQSLADHALALYAEGDDARNLARLRITRAWLLMKGDDPKPHDALKILDVARQEVEAHGSTIDLFHLEHTRAEVYQRLGRLQEAGEMLVNLLQNPGPQMFLQVAVSRMHLALIYQGLGDRDGALREAKEAAQTLDETTASKQAATAWSELGSLYRDLDRADEALDAYDRALRLSRVFPDAIPEFVTGIGHALHARDSTA